jgi:hypothetical protein
MIPLDYCPNPWNIVFFRQKLESAADCGQIHPGYFVVNLDTFSEAQRFNTRLNKEVGIYVEGNTKNCLSCPAFYDCPASHGHSGMVAIGDVVGQPQAASPASAARCLPAKPSSSNAWRIRWIFSSLARCWSRRPIPARKAATISSFRALSLIALTLMMLVSILL